MMSACPSEEKFLGAIAISLLLTEDMRLLLERIKRMLEYSENTS